MPRGGVLARIIGPGGAVLSFLLTQGVGNSLIKKIARGFCRGGGGGGGHATL